MNRTCVCLRVSLQQCRRNISSSCTLYKNKKMIIKYKNRYEDNPRSIRTDIQRLMDRAKGKIPYDKRFIVTGKDVGPSVEGGSKEAQIRAALHLVQPSGYMRSTGTYVKVKKMVPEFIVPNLEGFKLKPYVSYKATEVNQSKLTARDIFNSCYADGIAERFQKEKSKKSEGLNVSRWLSRKGSKDTNEKGES